MSKALKVICLISLLAAASPALRAQPPAASDPVATASEEGVRRDYETLVLRKTLMFARTERQQGNLAIAAKHYQECYVLAQKIGPFVDPEMQEVIRDYSSVLMAQAAEDQKRHKYADAEEKYDHILKMDARNQAAQMARRDNHKLVEGQMGRIPSKEATDKIPSIRTNEVNVATLVQDGKFYFEAGRLDEAEDKLNRAMQMDPSSVAANYYLRLVKEKRMSDATRKSELASSEAMLQVERSWDVEQRAGQMVPRPNPFNRTNLVYTSKGRQNIMSKLDRIRIDEVKFDNLPLPEVIRNLSALARQRDPDREGINFMIDRQAAGAGGSAGIDPTTQLPLPPAEAVDITAINVKIDPPLVNVRLADVLDAITKTSEKPIKYSILDYAVSFSTRSQEPVPLEIRTFRVDPNTFRQGLESVTAFAFGDNITTTQGGGGGGGGGTSGGGSSGSSGGQGGSGSGTATIPKVNIAGGTTTGGGGGGGQQGGQGGQGGGGIRFVTSSTNTTDQLAALVRNFFTAAGIDFNTNTQSGKTFVFNDRKGVLTVRATAQDLDMIAAAIETLNQSPPQVNIKAKFAEITQNDNRQLGFQWTLGNFGLGGNSVIGSGGTAPSLNTTPTTLNPLGTFPGVAFPASGGGLIPAANTLTAPASSDGVLAGPSGLRNPLNAPTIATLTGIMTDPQFRVAMTALQTRDGVDLLTAPEVTTESGRQAEMQAVDLQTIVTQNTAQSSGGGFSGTQSGVNSPIVNQAVLIQPGTQLLPFGPVLDVIPYVSADEFSIQMTIIPTITEFIGYDDPGQFVVQAQQAAGSAPITAQLPLPHFRMRQVTTSVCVWDAQTVVMGGLITDSVTKTKDKVPMLGDLPLVGRLFRSESSSKSKKNLMIFVTPTIINPDGTRYHSDEEMPFIQNTIPPQRTAVTQ